MTTTTTTFGAAHLTHSRMACAKTCLRKHYLSYEVGLRKEYDSEALRMGAAYHLALEVNDTDGVEMACKAVRDNYANVPAWADPGEWSVECEKVLRLFMAHVWRWQGDEYEVVSTEQAFDLPLINPDTNAASQNWRIAGKIDRIVRLPDGRLAVMEYKTTSDDLNPDSDYWRRLRLDQQISMYVLAARELTGEDVAVIYDVTRKPTIRPQQVPLLDENGCKIVLDANGERVMNSRTGEPRQSADKAKGYELQSRTETAGEYGDRLTADIGERPDFYFARQEIPRLESDLDEFRHEVWDIAKTLRDCQRFGRWYRNTGACLHPYKCEFFDVCSNGIDAAAHTPVGFVKGNNIHPELND